MFRRLIVILSAAVACLLPASESVSATAAIAGDADTYDATIGQRADVPARALDLDSAFARGAREGVASTTTVDAAPFTYDVPTISRVGDHEFDDASASAARLRDVREGSASLSVEARGTSTTPSAQGVATEAADDAARFVVDSAGNTTLRAQGPSGWIDVTSHAAKRMTQRGISIADVDQALTQTPFNYWHSNTWKVGYYDPGTNVFVGTVNGVATTVITPSAGAQYVANLLAAAP